MFRCLNAGKYIQITMKEWKYDTLKTRVKSDQCNNSGVGKENQLCKSGGRRVQA